MIKIKNISFGYDVNLLFNDFSVDIETGKNYAIFGENGIGKTTFLNILNEKLSYDGKITGIPDRRMMIATPAVPIDYITGFEFLEMTFELKKIVVSRQKILDLSIVLGLSEDVLFNRYISEYSKGMKYKLLMVISLLSKIDLLLLDEPFSELDIKTNNILSSLMKKTIKTVIFTTHTPMLALMYADYICIFDKKNGMTMNKADFFKDEQQLMNFINNESRDF